MLEPVPPRPRARNGLSALWLVADRAALMSTFRHWLWVMSQTEVPASATDRLVWELTALAVFLGVVAVVLGLAVRALWKNR